MKPINKRLTVMLLMCILLPTGLIGLTLFWMLENTIKENRIQNVGLIAETRHETMRQRLLADNQRSKDLLTILIAVCRNPAEGINACIKPKLEQFAIVNHIVGISFHSGIQSDVKLGTDTVTLEDLKLPFHPGQLAATSKSRINSDSLFSLLAVDSASGFSMVTTYSVQTFQDIFVNSPVLGESGETFLADREGFFVTKQRYSSQQGTVSPISAIPMQHCLQHKNFEMLGLDYRNVAIIHGFRFVPEIGGGCIMAHVDQVEAFTPLMRLFAALAAAGLVFIGFAGVIAKTISGNISRPVKALANMAQVLRDSEARLRALLNTTAIAIVAINEQGLIEEFNPASEIIFGYSKAEVIGRNVKMLMPEPYCSNHDSFLKNYLLAGQGKNIGFEREVHGRHKRGTIFPMELNLGEAQLGKQRVFIGFIKDISERKQMERTRQQFEAIVQSSEDAIISKTLAGLVISWNHGAEKLFGYNAAEMIDNPLLKLFPPERSHEESYLLEQIALGHPVKHFETVCIRKNGTLVDVSISLSPIHDNAGTIIGASKIVRDITLHKQQEQELLAAKQTAEAASRSKSEFLANMSHEIRTPMNAVIGLTRLVMETELSCKQQDYLTKIQNASQALLIILNDILDLSKIEAGRLDIEQVEFDPTAMLQSISDLFIAKVEEKGLEIFLEVAPEIPLTVMGDPLRIQQVLSNLVSNAIKFTPEGEIHICMALETRSNAGLVLRLSVRDTGIGMSEISMENLFQSFSQADASITRKFGGTGLGLAISKKLVELMGGTISASSQLGHGSTFSFTVRCRKGQSYDWEHDSHWLKNSRILVVDDQETSCTILRNILESWHLQVDSCLSAQAGLEKIYAAEQAGKPFNLLLLDWKMEGMNGLDLTHDLRQKELQGELEYHPTIIMVTAHCKEQLLAEIADSPLHIDSILTKPVVPSSLLNTLLHVYRYQTKAIHQPPKTQIDSYQAARPLRNTRLLLVEDNELNQQVAGEFLEKAGLRVSTANHGGEAVQWLKKTDFDVVLMDLQMPEMDGFEATRQIRQLPNCLHLPIIAMTAAAMQNDREACLAAGMNDHIAKPIQPMELINTLLHWVKPVAVESVADILPGQQTGLALPGFDLENIMIMLANDEQKLTQLLISFRERFANQAPSITGKIKSGELNQAEKELHTLKGAAGNLGAKELYQVSATLDAELVKGRCDPETLAQWQKILRETMDNITTFTLRSQTKLVESSPVAVETLQQTLTKLDQLLANDDFIGDELLMQLKNLLPDDRQTQCHSLNQLIVNTDYVQARAVLNALRGLLNGSS